MSLFFLSFLSGILTVFAPCSVFVLLTVLAASAMKTRPGHVTVLIGSFIFAWMAFMLASSLVPSFAQVDFSVWRGIAWGLMAGVGIVLIFPSLRRFIFVAAHPSSYDKTTFVPRERLVNGLLVWTALGIIFASGFPLRADIAVEALLTSVSVGLVHLLLYVFGFAFTLLFVSVFGQSIIRHFVQLHPKCFFRRIVGGFLLFFAVIFALGIDTRLEEWLVQRGWDRLTPVEHALLEHRFDQR